MDEIEEKIAVVVGPEDLFAQDLVFAVFPNVRTVVATRTFAIPVLDPQAVLVEAVGAWLVGIFLKISQMPLAGDGVSSRLKHLPKGLTGSAILERFGRLRQRLSAI